MAHKVMEKFLESVLFIVIVAALAPTLTTYLGYLAGNMTGFGLVALFATGGIIYILIAYFVFNHLYKMWATK
jgi:hypothetical protein